MKTTTTSTQTEALIMKEKMKLYRPKFRKGKTKTKTSSSDADGNHTSSIAKQIGCFPKRFACGAKQQLQLQPQQAPKDEKRQEPDGVIKVEDVQATKKAEDDEQLAEERIPAEKENDEEVSENGQEEDVKESKISLAADIDTTPNSNDLTSKVIDDKVEDADNEHTAESKDYIPKPDEQPEEAVSADEDNNKVSIKEEGAVQDSRETINSMTTTTNANMMMDNARVAMETAMCTFTNALETAMSSMSSHKGGGADDNDQQQDKSASESSSPEGPKDVGTAGERQPEDNNVSVDPLEKQASIKPKVVAENHEESTTDSSNNKNKRPPLMPPSKLQNTNKTKVEKKTKAAASKGNNALKNLKASLTRSSKKEESLSPTVGPDSVKSWPMAQKKKTVSRFRKTGSNRRAALNSAAAATTKPDVQKKGEDEEEEEGSTKGENSTLATPNTMRRNEAETTAADGQVDGKDDIPTDVDVRHSSRDDEIETSIPIWSPDNFVFNCTHTLSSRCSQKDKKEETAPNKNEEANKFVPSGSQKSLSSRTGEKEKSNPVTTAVGMGGAIGSAVSLFMRSLAANPHKEESKMMDSEAIASAPNSKTTPETEKVVDASYQEQQGNSGGVASAGSSCAKEKSLGSEEVSRSGSEKGKDATMEKLTSDSKENESSPVVADQPEPEGPVSTKVSGEEETTDNESSSKAITTTSDTPIIATVDETPKSDDASRSSPILPEQQEQTDLALDTVSIKNSNGSMTEAVTSVNRNTSACSAVQPIDGDTRKGVEDEIPLQGLQILQSSSSAADDQEQRQEDDGEKAGGENICEGDHEGTSNCGKGAEEEANGSSNNIDNTTVMRSELLEGKLSFGRSNSNISSTSVDKNAMAATAAIDQKKKKAEDEVDVEDQREDPVSDEGSREEVIVDATRKFTDTYAMVNRERKKQALSELRRSTYLDSLATSHAIVMAELLTLGHSVDSLAALQDQLHSDDVGENIQRGTDERAMHKLAMEAGTSSRYNILRPTYKQYGMGTAVGEDGMVYMVQLFRGPVKEAFHQVERPEPSSVWCSSLWC
jgi:uncharacterized protein YkwD